MPQNENESKIKEKKALHLSVNVLKQFTEIRDAANKKDYGKRVSLEEVAACVLHFVDKEAVIKRLRDSSMRSQDHVEHIYQTYCKTKGQIDFNDFLLKALIKQLDVDIDIKQLSKAAANN